MDRIIATASESKQGHDKKFVHFYCVKARDFFKTNIYEEITFKNGKKALKATNPTNNVVSYLIIKQK
jgi:hypothetical protein